MMTCLATAVLAAPAGARAPDAKSPTSVASGWPVGDPGRSAAAAVRRKPLSTFLTGRAREYASVLNRLREVVDPATRIFSMVVPTGRSLKGFEDRERKYLIVEEQLDTLNEHLDPGVLGVDAMSVMSEHADEYLFFRTDHHWTALGAYYAYRTLAEAAGLRPLSIDEFDKREGSRRFLGSLYRRNRTWKMRSLADTVDYYVPPVTHEAVRYSRMRPKRAVESTFLREEYGTYKMFLGGDHPLMVAQTGVRNGKSVMLVKNSYGNPFAIYLLSHYERVVVVDYRHQKRALPDLVDEYEIDDLVILNISSLSASRSHIRHMKALLRGRR